MKKIIKIKRNIFVEHIELKIDEIVVSEIVLKLNLLIELVNKQQEQINALIDQKGWKR